MLTVKRRTGILGLSACIVVPHDIVTRSLRTGVEQVGCLACQVNMHVLTAEADHVVGIVFIFHVNRHARGELGRDEFLRWGIDVVREADTKIVCVVLCQRTLIGVWQVGADVTGIVGTGDGVPHLSSSHVNELEVDIVALWSLCCESYLVELRTGG